MRVAILSLLVVLLATASAVSLKRLRGHQELTTTQQPHPDQPSPNGPRQTIEDLRPVPIDRKGVEAVPGPLPPPVAPCNKTNETKIDDLQLIPEFKPVYVNTTQIMQKKLASLDGGHVIPELRDAETKEVPHHRSLQRLLPVMPEVRDTPTRECPNGCAPLNVTTLPDGKVIMTPIKLNFVKVAVADGDEIMTAPFLDKDGNLIPGAVGQPKAATPAPAK